MKLFMYETGEEIKSGDRITFHGEQGRVEFVVAESVGDQALDWYLDQYPGGGLMVKAEGFGDVFLTGGELYEDLKFIGRRDMSEHEAT